MGHSEKRVWYFAFGANMSTQVITRRRGVYPLTSEAARLDGYRLTFSEPGIPLVEPGFANIEPDDDAVVYGVLHYITQGDLAALDQVEGADYSHVEVDVVGDRSGRVRAHAYRNLHPGKSHRPSRRYLELLRRGAREHGLPASYLAQLDTHPSVYIPVLSGLVRRSIGGLERLRRWGLRHEVLLAAYRRWQARRR